jgi:hypothetical protein
MITASRPVAFIFSPQSVDLGKSVAQLPVELVSFVLKSFRIITSSFQLVLRML